MRIDWREWRAGHPRSFMAMVAVKRLRTKVGLVLGALCAAKSVYFNEPPFDLDEPNPWVVLGLLLVVLDVAMRLAAYGSIHKKESLATTGVYSLCRHPLYLGSMLMTYGFCLLYDDTENWVVATAYFMVFYGLAIVWEEIRLAERYGEVHRQYALTTPLIIPPGRFRPDRFSWSAMAKNGGVALVLTTVLLIACTEALAEIMRRFTIGIIP